MEQNTIISQLLEQNKMMMEQMSLVMKSNIKSDKTEEYLQSCNPIDFNVFLKSIREEKLLNLNDISFLELGFVTCITQMMEKLLKNRKTRPLHTVNKKEKIFAVYVDGEWEKIVYTQYVDYIKKLIKYAVHYVSFIFTKNKSKYNMDFRDQTISIMYSDTDSYKESIANKLIEYLVMI